MSKEELDYNEIMNMILNKNKDLPKMQKEKEKSKAADDFHQMTVGTAWKPTRRLV
jgi:hypothetical protein